MGGNRIRARTDHIGGVVGIHERAELGVDLGAAVDGAGGGAEADKGDLVEGDGTHVDEHDEDVGERREEEHPLPPEEQREEGEGEALHPRPALRRRPAGEPSGREGGAAGRPAGPPRPEARRAKRRRRRRRRRRAQPALNPVVGAHLPPPTPSLPHSPAAAAGGGARRAGRVAYGGEGGRT